MELVVRCGVHGSGEVDLLLFIILYYEANLYGEPGKQDPM
jgi:hypothetical protein